MSRKTQAEIFIKTLTKLRDEELERQKARLRLQLKVHVKRFMKAFRTEFDGSLRPAEWTPRSKQTAEKTVRQIPDE